VTYQSALVVLIPEAEPVVGPFRTKYDSSAADGMPAHITINYPFLPAPDDEPGVIHKLRTLFSLYPHFTFSLEGIKRFPGVLYLEPSPARPLNNLIQAIAERLPESPPYGGVFEEVIPHLTVAAVEDEKALDRISEQFGISCAGKFPIRSAVNEVWLMDNRSGRWTKRTSFQLADKDTLRQAQGGLS
jgi:2'-5' RNA ligase